MIVRGQLELNNVKLGGGGPITLFGHFNFRSTLIIDI